MAVLYKISEVSKITGIPIDTIRYYVKEGLIAPVRRNSYHYYSTWDIHYLMDYKKYRFLEMSPNDIRGVFFNDTLEEYTERLHTMRDYYHSRSVYYHLLEKRNCIIEDLLHEIPAVIGHFRMTEYPEAYFLRYTRKTDFAVNENSQLKQHFDRYFSFVEGVVSFPFETVSAEQPVDDYEWLLCMRADYLRKLEKDLKDDLPFIPAHKALYTVIYAQEEGTFTVSLLEPILRYVHDHGYRITGNIYGILLAKARHQQEYRRYIGLYIPVA